MGAKAVVITGASTGIGRACALHLDRIGWRVFAGVRKTADGETLRRQAAGVLTPILIDVTSTSSLTAAVEIVTKNVGEAGLAGLVNNAGVAVAGPLEFLPLAELRRQLEVNVIGQVAVTQAFLPLLRQGHGRVVNMGSVSGRIAMPLMGPYAASKFALEALTDALRVELAPWNIQVSIIEPGSIATPIWDKSVAMADEIIENLPPPAHRYYGSVMATVRQQAIQAGRIAIPPQAVAEAVTQALTARRPKTRYLVGRGVWLAVLFARFVPDRWRDWLITRSGF